MEALRQSVERNRAARKTPAKKTTAKKSRRQEVPAKKTAAKKPRPRRRRRRRPAEPAGLGPIPVYCVNMGIGLGIVLIVIGRILLFALKVTCRSSPTTRSGIILIVAGVLALAIGLLMQFPRGRTKHVQENRYDGPPPAA